MKDRVMTRLRALPALLVVLAIASCGNGDAREPAAPLTSVTSSPTSTTSEVRSYRDHMLDLVDEAEALIERTPETPANDYGWGTVAGAYRGLARAMEEVPAPSPVTHEALIAEAEMIADEAEALADKTNSIAQLGGAVSLAERQREFRDAIAALK
jgi:hypothetical protein